GPVVAVFRGAAVAAYRVRLPLGVLVAGVGGLGGDVAASGSSAQAGTEYRPQCTKIPSFASRYQSRTEESGEALAGAASAGLWRSSKLTRGGLHIPSRRGTGRPSCAGWRRSSPHLRFFSAGTRSSR